MVEDLIDPKVWYPYDRPGYFGAKRDEKQAAFDEKFGPNNWRLGWLFGGHIISWLGACAIYEDAYYEFLRSNDKVLKKLLKTASDVYDDYPSNVESGLAYDIQETDRTHIQDIAIRNCLFRLHLKFGGNKLVQIQGQSTHQIGRLLSPGRVPFHLSSLIIQPQLKGWWQNNSVESFYQSNKFLLVRQ